MFYSANLNFNFLNFLTPGRSDLYSRPGYAKYCYGYLIHFVFMHHSSFDPTYRKSVGGKYLLNISNFSTTPKIH